MGIFIFLEWYNSPQQIGKRGEEFVHDILTNLSEEYYILDDIVLETQRGTTQIDHIVVSKYGIFVIETKNYSGDIYGDDYRQQWTQIIVTDVVYERNIFKEYTYVTKSHFYNPVKQSLSHCNVIRKSILHGWDIPVVPIVIFVGKADLRNVDTNHHVVYEYDLLSTIQSYQTEYLSSSDIQKFLTKLTEKNVREFVDNKTHVRNIEATITEKNEKYNPEFVRCAEEHLSCAMEDTAVFMAALIIPDAISPQTKCQCHLPHLRCSAPVCERSVLPPNTASRRWWFQQ